MKKASKLPKSTSRRMTKSDLKRAILVRIKTGTRAGTQTKIFESSNS